MNRSIFITLSLIIPALSLQADSATQVILHSRAAVNLSPVRLYKDSSFSKVTEIAYPEGELFEVIGETSVQHFDAAQIQTFKWYHIKTMKGQTGWVFGDNLAITLPEQLVSSSLKSINKQTAHFDNGFENAIFWLASIDGFDDIHKNKGTTPNPIYKESYLFITNERGQSVSINYGGANDGGRKELKNIRFQDLTDDKINEIVIETASFPTGTSFENRTLEIFSFKSGALSKIFEERLTLTFESDTPSPALFKSIEIDKSNIRVAYMDYVPCAQYTLKLPTDIRSQTQERCLEYVTYSYLWDKATKKFTPLYKESRTAPTASVKEPVTLTTSPSTSGKLILSLQPNERLIVIKHYDNLKIINGQKQVENYLYIKHPSGVFGYIPADKVRFRNTEHAKILAAYYAAPPLLKQDWKTEESFTK